MNTNIKTFYQTEAIKQMEFENFIIAEAHTNDLIALNRDDVYAESKMQARIEAAESRAEFESFNWNLNN